MDLFEYAEQVAAERGREVSLQQAARVAFAPSDDEQRQQRSDVLSALQAGPKTTSELIAIGGHRFSTSIDELRQRGHKISTERNKERIAIYTWWSFNPRCKVSESMQDAYYRCDHWKATAKARKDFDEWRCVQCHSTGDLETHHWIYHLFAESVESDLATLCRACHGTIHLRVAIHFPKFVDEATARRLACLEV